MFRSEKASGELPTSQARQILTSMLDLFNRCAWVNRGPNNMHEHCMQTAYDHVTLTLGSRFGDGNTKAYVALMWSINREGVGITYGSLPSFNDMQRSFAPIKRAIEYAMEIVDSITDCDCMAFGRRLDNPYHQTSVQVISMIDYQHRHDTFARMAANSLNDDPTIRQWAQSLGYTWEKPATAAQMANA